MTVGGSPDAAILELHDVTKSFGSTPALQGVSLEVNRGEVVALIGDNGAGKSTVVKLVTGFYAPTSGTIDFAGEVVRFSSPAQARKMGIEAVYQDLALVEDLSLWRNFFLGKELRHSVRWLPFKPLAKRRMRSICLDALEELGLTRIRSVDEPASTLSGGEKQSVAITRAIHFGVQLLLLDEPTAALSVRETINVLNTIRNAAERGLGVLYIDHNMAHVQPVADRVIVLEHGRVISEHKGSDVTVDDLAAMLSNVHRELGSD